MRPTSDPDVQPAASVQDPAGLVQLRPEDTSPAEVIELHWMTEPDTQMMRTHNLPTPTLCGTWMAAEAEAAMAGAPLPANVQFVACDICDKLALN